MHRATAVPRPAKPARQNVARPKLWLGPSCVVPTYAASHSGTRSDTYAAPASPAAARRSQDSSGVISRSPPDPSRRLGSDSLAPGGAHGGRETTDEVGHTARGLVRRRVLDDARQGTADGDGVGELRQPG